MEDERNIQSAKTQLALVRQLGQDLLSTWGEADPVVALNQTLKGILQKVDREVIPLQKISASVYVYDDDGGFHNRQAIGPLEDYMIKYPPRQGGTAEYIIHNKQPVFVDDVTKMPADLPRLSKWAIDHGVKSLANLPLLVGNTVVGALIINLQTAHHFDLEQQDILQLFATRAAIALQNARIHRRRLLEEQAIREISELTAAGTPGQVENLIARHAVELTRSAYATLWAIDATDSVLHLSGAFYTGDWEPPRQTLPVNDQSINGYVALTKESYYSDDLNNDSHYARWHDNVQAALCVPLLIGDGLIGTLYVANHNENGISDNNRQFIEQLANYAAIALNNARLLEQERQSRLEAEAIQTVIAELQSTLDLKKVGEVILLQLKKIIPYQTASLQEIDQAGNRLLFGASGFDINHANPHFTRPIADDPVASRVVKSKNPTILSDVAQYDFWKRDLKNVNSWAGVPLVTDGDVIGLLTLDHPTAGFYTVQKHRSILQTFAGHAGMAVRNATLLAALNNSALEMERAKNAGDVYAAIVTAVVKTLRCDYCTVYVWDSKKSVLSSTESGGTLFEKNPRLEFAPGEGLAGAVYQTRQAEIVANTIRDSRYKPRPSGKQDIPRSMMLAPLLEGERVIGVVSADMGRIDAFDSEDLRLLQTITAQAATAIDNVSRLQGRIEELEAINEFQHRISDIDTVEQELEDIYRAAVDVMKDLMDTDNMYIALYDEMKQMIEFGLAYEHGEKVDLKDAQRSVPYVLRPLGQRNGLTEWVIRHKESLLIQKGFDDWVEQQSDVEAFTMKTKCWLGAPMIYRDRVIGVIGLQNFERENVFDENHRRLLEMIAGQAAIAIDNARKLDRRIAELRAVSKFQQQIINIGTD
jgi:GAF domain-containing protein